MYMYFESREEAGQRLAAKLADQYRYENCAVVALSDGAVLVGEQIAAIAKEKKIEQAVYDRGGFGYLGAVKTVCETAREKGLKI